MVEQSMYCINVPVHGAWEAADRSDKVETEICKVIVGYILRKSTTTA